MECCFKWLNRGSEHVAPTWLVGNGADEVGLERQAQLLQGDGALGGRHAGKFWGCRGLFLALWVPFQTVQLCLQSFPLLR